MFRCEGLVTAFGARISSSCLCRFFAWTGLPLCLPQLLTSFHSIKLTMWLMTAWEQELGSAGQLLVVPSVFVWLHRCFFCHAYSDSKMKTKRHQELQLILSANESYIFKIKTIIQYGTRSKMNVGINVGLSIRGIN